MFFILRAAFWLSVVALLLPGEPTQAPKTTATAPTPARVETGAPARSTLEDLARFCLGQPATCEAGRNALETLGTGLRQGADRLAERFGGADVTPAKALAEEPRHVARAARVPLPQARPLS